MMPYVITRVQYIQLIHKQLEIYGCVFSTVFTDALVLKHQAISTHSADYVFILLVQFDMKILHFHQQH